MQSNTVVKKQQPKTVVKTEQPKTVVKPEQPNTDVKCEQQIYLGGKREFVIKARRRDTGLPEILGSLWIHNLPEKPQDLFLLAQALFEGSPHDGDIAYIVVPELVKEERELKELKIIHLLCQEAANKGVEEAKNYLAFIVNSIQAVESEIITKWQSVYDGAILKLKSMVDQKAIMDEKDLASYGDAVVMMQKIEAHLAEETPLRKKIWTVSGKSKALVASTDAVSQSQDVQVENQTTDQITLQTVAKIVTEQTFKTMQALNAAKKEVDALEKMIIQKAKTRMQANSHQGQPKKANTASVDKCVESNVGQPTAVKPGSSKKRPAKKISR